MNNAFPMPSGSSGISQISDDDVDALINDNGGSGEFESPEEQTEVDRWLFPRFEGATDEEDMYMTRSGIGDYDTDVETIGGWLDAPRNVVGAILLLGEPGTGKTALLEAAITEAKRKMITVICTPDHTKDSLFLRFVGEGKGDCVVHGHSHNESGDDFDNGENVGCVRGPYALGPFPYAAKYGYTLYCDEAMLLVDGVKPLLYAMADGRRFLPEGNVNGSALEIHPDFRLVLSSNPQVRGASLPEPLASRCASTTLTIETDANMLRDLGIDESVVQAWEGLGQANLWRPQIREVRLANYWLGISPTQAVSAFLPEHCPESQRKRVRDTVISFLGGYIRHDGRLVVK